MDSLFRSGTHLERMLHIGAIHPCCCQRWLVCSRYSQFPSQKIKLGMETEYYIGQRAEAHGMCKEEICSERPVRCTFESYPDTPKNRDPMKSGFLPDKERK